MSTPQPPSQPGPDDSGRTLSGIQRAGLVLIGLALLLIAFVVFRGADDEGSPERTTAAQTATATQTESADTATGDTGATETGTTGDAGTTGETETEAENGSETTTETQPAAPRVPTVRVEGGRPRGGVRTLSFEKGERIRFKVRADATDEVHVHGYDVTKALPAGQTVTFSFEATIEGRFEVELHGAGTQIAELEVTPS